MNLEQTALDVREQFPKGAQLDIVRQERRLERFGQIAFGGLGVALAVAIVGIIATVISRMILSGEQPWIGVMLVAFLIFAALTLSYVVFNEHLKDKKKTLRATASDPEVLPGSDANRLISEPAEPGFTSVTEDTTKLLDTEPRRRNLE